MLFSLYEITRFPDDISCFFGRYEISLWDHMLLAAELKMRVREKGCGWNTQRSGDSSRGLSFFLWLKTCLIQNWYRHIQKWKSIWPILMNVTIYIWIRHEINEYGFITRGFGWWSDVCSLENMFAFFGLSQYFLIDQGSSTFISCALTVNVIGLLFLRQCFGRLPPSTETSFSGTSRKLPICLKVSQNPYSGEWLDVTWTHAIVIGGFSRGFRVGGEEVM